MLRKLIKAILKRKYYSIAFFFFLTRKLRNQVSLKFKVNLFRSHAMWFHWNETKFDWNIYDCVKQVNELLLQPFYHRLILGTAFLLFYAHLPLLFQKMRKNSVKMATGLRNNNLIQFFFFKEISKRGWFLVVRKLIPITTVYKQRHATSINELVISI